MNKEQLKNLAEERANKEYPKIGEDLSYHNMLMGAKREPYIKGFLDHARLMKDESWLSPVESEREQQEKDLKKIYPSYPNANKWQCLNGLIYFTLSAAEDKKELLEALKLAMENFDGEESISEDILKVIEKHEQ